MKRYDLELTATGPVMEERQEGAFVPFSEVSGLADTVMKMGGRCTLLADMLREASKVIPAIGVAIDDLPVVDAFLERIEASLAGQVPEQHSDDTAVDRFAVAMKTKLAAARTKGRSGWDDPAACSVEFLADLLVNHVGKGNPGNFEDIANLAMMLHQRGAESAVLAHAATLTTCTRCQGHGMIGGVTGQTPESMDFWEAGCPDCDGRGKVKVKGRTITEGQELELSTVLQAIANGFSDDPAHDAAALLKRITGEVQWTGDSFHLPSRQGGEPCDSVSLSSSPD
ncbi:zinc finger-like domain-containing protein [Aeromonas hydrophila]